MVSLRLGVAHAHSGVIDGDQLSNRQDICSRMIDAGKQVFGHALRFRYLLDRKLCGFVKPASKNDVGILIHRFSMCWKHQYDGLDQYRLWRKSAEETKLQLRAVPTIADILEIEELEQF